MFWLQPDVRRLLEVVPRPASASTAGGPSSTHVVVVVFDEVPLLSLVDEQLLVDKALFPNLARLARDGVWFRNATTVSDYTRWALPAIVTGMRPLPEAAPSARDHPRSIFSLLAWTHEV
jgi:hypothetical protein